MSYVDGFVIPLPEGKIDAYREMAEKAGKIWMEHGALAYKECIGDDLHPEMPEGMAIDSFPNIARTNQGETVIFAFILFKSREHRDEVNAKVMQDDRMKDGCTGEMPFEVNRMVYGGFKTLVDL